MEKQEKTKSVKNITRALGFVNAMRNIDDTLDTSSFGIFLLVCSKEGISNDDIISYFGNIHKARV